MADLTTRTELATYPAPEDLIHVVDVSDTTDAAGGTSKKIQYQNLLQAVGSQEMVVRKEIETITNSSAASFDFSGIPAGYDRLVIQGKVRSDVTGTSDNLYVFFNGDTTVINYRRQSIFAGGGTPSGGSGNDPRIAVIPAASSPTDAYSDVYIVVNNYSSSDIKTALNNYTGLTTASVNTQGQHAVTHTSLTSAITSISLVTDNDPTDQLVGSLTLYAEKVQTVAPENPNVQTLTVLKPLGTISCDGATVTQADFTGLDATNVNYFVIKGRARGTEAVAETSMVVYLNGDTTAANYFNQAHTGNNGITGAGESAAALGPDVPGSSGSANSYADVEIRFPNPGGSDIKGYESTYSAVYTLGSAARTGHRVVRHDTLTSAITQITLDVDAGNLVGDFTLYAEVDAVVGAVTYPGDAGTEGRFLQKIATIDNSSAAGSFDWSSIPQHPGGDLVIKGWVRSDVAATSDIVYAFFNGDTTTTNYFYQRNGAVNGSANVSEANNPTVIQCPAASSPSNARAAFEIRIPDYAGSGLKGALSVSGFYYDSASTRVVADDYYMTSLSSTSAITSLSLTTDNDPTDELFGEATLYVERDIVMSPGKHEIETIENLTAGTFDFQNIPAGFKRLWIEGYVQGDVAGTNDVMLIAFNNDTTDANYFRQYTSEGGTSVSTAEAADRRIGVTAGGNSVGESKISIKVEGYADSCLKSARCDTESYRTSGADLAMSRSVVYHDSMTAAITRITLTTDNDPTDEFTGKLTLYGEH